MTGITCNTCQCSRCENVDCGWHGCVLGKPGENCFISDCMQYENEQEKKDARSDKGGGSDG